MITFLVEVSDPLNFRVKEAHLLTDTSNLLLSMLSLLSVLVRSLLKLGLSLADTLFCTIDFISL